MKDFQEAGGAENYIGFIKEELIPLIDSNYRTNSQRILNGYSLGGLLTLNLLLDSPDLFDHYIAGSPYLEYDFITLNEKFKHIDGFNNRKRIFISVGELEDKKRYRIPIKRIYNQLNNKSNLNVKFELFKNGTHFTCPSKALAYGLKHIFTDNSPQEQ